MFTQPGTKWVWSSVDSVHSCTVGVLSLILNQSCQCGCIEQQVCPYGKVQPFTSANSSQLTQHLLKSYFMCCCFWDHF